MSANAARDELPTGTVTFLLTDVEGSTRLWDRDPARASALMAAHDRTIEDLATEHHGHVVRPRGEGDSRFVVFARATDAVAAALAMQRALVRDGELAVRMALHTGEAELREHDYYGGGPNRCARLRELAHGTQVLVSRATQDLIADALPDEVTLEDLGEHRLRDLGRPEQVFQLHHPDLPAEFPPLASLSTYPNNLPFQVTSFIARGTEIEHLERLLEHERLVTLTGAGGCGKTRLALHAAATMLDRFPEGAWWVDLAPLTDASGVEGAAAAALSVRPRRQDGAPDEPVREALLRTVAARRMLVILDNCEHLIDACAELASTLIARCPSICIIATSREPLGVEPERTLRVPSLGVPEPLEGGSGDITGFDAVRLFVERATRARPDFALTGSNASAVADICRRLDGIPLAIELAAARTRVLSPAQISQGLQDRFHLLTGGHRGSLPRQRTLEASVDWSYRLLSDTEARMFARASVFAGSFDLDAATAVSAEDEVEGREVLDLLTRLVDRSMLQAEDVGDHVRYRMLETLKVFAARALAETDDVDRIRDRHLAYHEALAVQAEPELLGATLMTWWQRLAPAVDDLRLALDHALEAGATESVVRIVVGLGRFWETVPGSLREVDERLERALAAGVPDDSVRLLGLVRRAGLSDEHREEGIALAHELGDTRALITLFTAQGWDGFWSGDPDHLRHLEEAHRLAREVGDPTKLAGTLAIRSWVMGMAHGFRSALPIAEEHIELARREQDAVMLTHASAHIAWWAAIDGFLAEAERFADVALETARGLGSPLRINNALLPTAVTAVFRGDYATARRHVAASHEIYPSSDDRRDRIEALLAWVTGDLADALRLAQAEVERLMEESANLSSWLHVSNIAMVGAIAFDMGDRDRAREHLERSLTAARTVRHTWPLTFAQFHAGRVARADGDLARAESLEHEALSVQMAHGYPAAPADILEDLAGIAIELESHTEGVRLMGAAQRQRDAIGYPRYPVFEQRYATDVAAARAALGDEAFEAAWTEGTSMGLETAVAYAQRGRGERKRPSAGWASLTPVELEVTNLVAEGLSNPKIAERLFISRHTVKVHLSHVFAKLGMSSRSELAAEVARRQA